MEVTAQDLEQLLQERSGRVADVDSEGFRSAQQKRPVEEAAGKEDEEDTKEEEAGYSLVAVSQGMKDFLNTISSHEGAEAPWSDKLHAVILFKKKYIYFSKSGLIASILFKCFPGAFRLSLSVLTQARWPTH